MLKNNEFGIVGTVALDLFSVNVMVSSSPWAPFSAFLTISTDFQIFVIYASVLLRRIFLRSVTLSGNDCCAVLH